MKSIFGIEQRVNSSGSLIDFSVARSSISTLDVDDVSFSTNIEFLISNIGAIPL